MSRQIASLVFAAAVLLGVAEAQQVVQPSSGSGSANPAGSNGDVQMKSGTALAAAPINCVAGGDCTTGHGFSTGFGSGNAGYITFTQGAAVLPAGTNGIIMYAPATVGTGYNVKLPAAAATGFVKWTATGAAVVQALVSSTRSFGATFVNGGSAITATNSAARTIPVACTITAWDAAVDTGTATFKVWKIATGTAIPTVSNSINTSGVGVSTATAIHSTTVSDFTSLAVSANDIYIISLTAVTGSPTWATFSVQCDQ